MPRVKHAPSSLKRRKKVLKLAKGYRGGRSKLYRTAQETVRRAMAYAYRDRKAKKRSWRNLWILRINAACRDQGISYSRLIQGLKKTDIGLDRKMLAELAVHDGAAFAELVRIAREEAAGEAPAG